MGESPKGNEGPSEKGVCVSVGGRDAHVHVFSHRSPEGQQPEVPWG